MILPASYIPAAIALDYLPKRWAKSSMIIFVMLCCGSSLFFVGPTTMINCEDNMLMLMIIGQVLLGLFIPLGLILALPSMVESVAPIYPN